MRRRALAAAVGVLASGLVAWLAAAAALDRYGASPPPPGPYAAIVVAGAGVMPGGVPGDALVARTRLAVDLYAQGYAPTLALTGGVGDWGPAESAVARELAVRWGVPADAVVTEDRSRSTAENAAEIAAVLGDVPVLVVTDRYHALRCRRVFGRRFHDVQVAGAVSPWPIRFRGAVREVLAVTWYTVLGRM
ncbi:MAG: YdcF family protein [Myxococcota bacterium]